MKIVRGVHWLIAGSATSPICLLGAEASFALDTTNLIGRTAALGSCDVYLDSYFGHSNGAYVILNHPGGQDWWAGGSEYRGFPMPLSQTGLPAIDAAAIQASGLTNVTNLAEDGANSSFVADDYVGFSFRAVDPNDGLTYDYEYALKGVTNTQVIITKVLHPPPGSVGAHRKVGDNAAIGLMAQFDHIKHDDPLGGAKGDGWLIGPYVVAKVPEKEIFIDARALWGRTDNDITATGNPTDNVDCIRSLMQVRASTRLDFGAVQVRPRVEIARARESTGTFIDGVGTPVAGVSSAINQAAAGVTVSRDIALAGGTLGITGALDGIWTNTTSGPDAAYEDGRARIAVGLNYITDSAGTFSASAFLDGIAQDGYEGRGLSLAYNLQF